MTGAAPGKIARKALHAAGGFALLTRTVERRQVEVERPMTCDFHAGGAQRAQLLPRHMAGVPMKPLEM